MWTSRAPLFYQIFAGGKPSFNYSPGGTIKLSFKPLLCGKRL